MRDSAVREAQAELARQHGVEGFCYWHYWFAGRRVLERPFEEVLSSGRPRLPFCLAWANTSWTGAWYGAPGKVLLRQTYPGRADFESHFRAVLPALSDERYVKIDGRCLFIVFRPAELPDGKEFCETWRELAHRAGLAGLFLIGMGDHGWDPRDHGFDASVFNAPSPTLRRLPPRWLGRFLLNRAAGPAVGRLLPFVEKAGAGVPGSILRRLSLPFVVDYETAMTHSWPAEKVPFLNFPTVIPNWDNTPRSLRQGIVLQGSTPQAFARHFAQALSQVSARDFDKKVIFLRAWNEWAEGNYVEPDARFGRGYLEAIREAVTGAPPARRTP